MNPKSTPPIDFSEAEISQIQNTQMELKRNFFLQCIEWKFKARELLLKNQAESTIYFLEVYKRKLLESIPDCLLKMKVKDFLHLSGTLSFEEMAEKVVPECKDQNRENEAAMPSEKTDVHEGKNFGNSLNESCDPEAYDPEEKENKLNLANLQEAPQEAPGNIETKKNKPQGQKIEKNKAKFRKGNQPALKKNPAPEIIHVPKMLANDSNALKPKPVLLRTKNETQAPTSQTNIQNTTGPAPLGEAPSQHIPTGFIKKPWLP